MSLGQIIILATYVIGTVIIIRHQNERNKTLRSQIETLHTQIESQSGILQQTERFMNIFKVDEVEKYVEMSRKKFLLEKEDKIREIEEAVAQKADLEKATKDLASQFAELLVLVSKIVYFTGAPSIIEKLISNMEEGFAKKNALKGYEKAKQELEKSKIPYPWEMLEAILKRSGAFHPDKNKPSSQK